MLRMQQSIPVGNIKLIIANIMQEHIDTAKVVRGQVEFLAKETLTDIPFTEDFCRFQKQRTRTAGGIIDLIDLCFPDNRNASQ